MPTKIIKPGKKPGNECDPIRFERSRCGCVFEVDANEVGARRVWAFPDYFATCPNCHRLCCTDGDER